MEKEADELENLCLEAKLNKNQYLVRHRYYSEDQDFGITLSNRAGQMQNAEFSIPNPKEPLINLVLYLLILFFRLPRRCIDVSS